MHGRRHRVGLAAVVLAIVVAISLPAAAQTSPPSAEEQLDECLGDRVYPNGPPTCTFDLEGNLIDRDVPGVGDQAPGLGGFLFMALLWAALPMVIAGAVASSRGQSVGLAVLLGLVLGWIGLLIVVFLQKPEVVDAARNTLAATAAGDVPDQIRKLGELRDQGLLTDEEFSAKKAQLLGIE